MENGWPTRINEPWWGERRGSVSDQALGQFMDKEDYWVRQDEMRDLLFPGSRGKPRGPTYHPLDGPRQFKCYECGKFKIAEEMADVLCYRPICLACEGRAGEEVQLTFMKEDGTGQTSL